MRAPILAAVPPPGSHLMREPASPVKTAPAVPVKRIEDFSSDVTVAPDGDLTVKETISVHSDGHLMASCAIFPRSISLATDIPSLIRSQPTTTIQMCAQPPPMRRSRAATTPM
jgi:hypothetical protein